MAIQKEQERGALIAHNPNTGTVHAVKENSYDGKEKGFDTLCGRISEGIVTRGEPIFLTCKICKKRFKEGFHKSTMMEFVEKVKREGEVEEKEWNLPPWYGEIPADSIDILLYWLFYRLETIEESMDDEYHQKRGWYPPGVEYNRGIKSDLLTVISLAGGQELIEEFYEKYEKGELEEFYERLRGGDNGA